MTSQQIPRLRLTALVVLVTSLTACASMSGIEPTAVVRNAASFGLPVATPVELASTSWWREFGDEQLNTLISQALTDNPSLKLVQSRLARARAVTEVADAALLPQVNAGLDFTHQRYTSNGAVPAPLAGSERSSGTLQFSTSWELDFFGKYRAALAPPFTRRVWPVGLA